MTETYAELDLALIISLTAVPLPDTFGKCTDLALSWLGSPVNERCGVYHKCRPNDMDSRDRRYEPNAWCNCELSADMLLPAFMQTHIALP